MLSRIISSKLLNITKSSTVFLIMMTFVFCNDAQASLQQNNKCTLLKNTTVAQLLALHADDKNYSLVRQYTVDGREAAEVDFPGGRIFLGPDNESGVPVVIEPKKDDAQFRRERVPGVLVGSDRRSNA